MTTADQTFTRLKNEWSRIGTRGEADATRWTRQVQLMGDEENQLRDQGRWAHGRLDFLGVISRERDELSHSRMIAWCLDPCARHGLGTLVLAQVIKRLFGTEAIPVGLSRARVACEVPLAEGRLDIDVTAPGFRLVIENKIDAIEDGQCEYYAEHLSSAALCVLLSPDGRSAVAKKGHLECSSRFRPLRYSEFAEILRHALTDATGGHGTQIARDYLLTLEAEFK